MSKFSERLKELREDKGLSARKLAPLIGVSDRSINRWEKEESLPDIEELIALAKFFDVTSDYLLGLTENY